MSALLKTRDYGAFKFDGINRPIDNNHVRALAASLQICNMMDDHPVLVDKDMRIQDGQHRVKAAELIGETVWYRKVEPISHEALIARQVQKGWLLSDYFHSYLALGSPEYVKLREIMTRFNLTFQRAILFHDTNMTPEELEKSKTNRRGIPAGSPSASLRSGTFRCQDIEQVAESMSKINRVTEFFRAVELSHQGTYYWLNSQMFAKSIITLCMNPEFEFDVFMGKLPLKLAAIGPRGRYQEYIKMWVDVYNYKNRNPISTGMEKVVDYD